MARCAPAMQKLQPWKQGPGACLVGAGLAGPGGQGPVQLER